MNSDTLTIEPLKLQAYYAWNHLIGRPTNWMIQQEGGCTKCAEWGQEPGLRLNPQGVRFRSQTSWTMLAKITSIHSKFSLLYLLYLFKMRLEWFISLATFDFFHNLCRSKQNVTFPQQFASTQNLYYCGGGGNSGREGRAELKVTPPGLESAPSNAESTKFDVGPQWLSSTVLTCYDKKSSTDYNKGVSF